jgi:CRP-like cAMP-binding protein
MRIRKYAAETVIYERGDAAEAAFEITSGKVKLVRPGAGGEMLTVVLEPGQIFGEVELLSGVRRPATAEALDEVTLRELRRDELGRIIAADQDLARSFLRVVFARLAEETGAAAAPSRRPAEPGAAPAVAAALRLVPGAPELVRQIGSEGLRIASLPFRVGRRSEHDHGPDHGPVELRLEDSRPYNLSRRHFSIERRNGGFILRDTSSHHGTVVNGTRIGGVEPVSVAPLHAGENHIVAGPEFSPFRFILLIEDPPAAA